MEYAWGIMSLLAFAAFLAVLWAGRPAISGFEKAQTRTLQRSVPRPLRHAVGVLNAVSIALGPIVIFGPVSAEFVRGINGLIAVTVTANMILGLYTTWKNRSLLIGQKPDPIEPTTRPDGKS